MAGKRSEAGVIVRFWGTRGGVACPGPSTIKYGGNTACVEVRCGDRTVIFDGGTGIRSLGNDLIAKNSTGDTDIFFSHFHLDHIGGFPFFAPCYSPTSRLRIWGGLLENGWTAERALGTIIESPFFPLRIDEFKATIDFHNFSPGETLQPHADMKLQTAMLNHPGGSVGYRLEFAGQSVAYITDTEHQPGELDPNVLELIRDADLMIYDGNYTDEEFLSHVGWGHSTWQHGVRLANAAGVKTLAIFHHDPGHYDTLLDAISLDAQAARPGTIIAREGLTLHLAPKNSDKKHNALQLKPQETKQIARYGSADRSHLAG